jgi:uncharacterized cupredoxin-like copper-binding protein
MGSDRVVRLRGRGPAYPRLIVVAAALAFAAVVLPACGGDDGDTAGTAETTPAASDTATEGTTVAVTLQEFAVAADPASVPSGSITFDVTNTGPDDVHEFVIIQTDLGATELPVDDDGAVLEDGEGMTVVDEIEDVAVDDTETLTVDLDAGAYVLICNILQEEPDGTLEAHYAEGMRTGFTVE